MPHNPTYPPGMYPDWDQQLRDQTERLQTLFAPETVTLNKYDYDNVIAMAAFVLALKQHLRGRPVETAVFSGAALAELFDLADKVARHG